MLPRLYSRASSIDTGGYFVYGGARVGCEEEADSVPTKVARLLAIARIRLADKESRGEGLPRRTDRASRRRQSTRGRGARA
jgi:hypothetical protein